MASIEEVRADLIQFAEVAELSNGAAYLVGETRSKIAKCLRLLLASEAAAIQERDAALAKVAEAVSLAMMAENILLDEGYGPEAEALASFVSRQKVDGGARG